MSPSFSSKANTLNKLQEHACLAIPPLQFLSFKEWKEKPHDLVSSLHSFFSAYGEHISLAVRSSCSREDNSKHSGAGAFTTLLYIKNSPEPLFKAIEEVFHSYTDAGKEAQEHDQVLVQLMLENSMMNGVIMTYVSDDGSPYYVINYDKSNKTDSITSGRGESKLLYIYRNFRESDFDSLTVYTCIEKAALLEKLCNHRFLDIEFCVTEDGVFHLLQVRPICTQHQWIADAENHVQKNINTITNFLHDTMKVREGLCGNTTFLGVMPDWNPAEIIGITPKPLASSMYREVITKRIWSQARERMGYKILPPDELMLLIAGRPYIDVRLSFNSFLPQNLEEHVAQKLVHAWLERLQKHTYFHDKVEFEVAQTLLDFSFEEHMQSRYAHVLSAEEKEHYKEQLRNLTNKNISIKQGSNYAWAMEQIAHLHSLQSKNSSPPLTSKQDSSAPLRRIISMVEECKNRGTLPFSILARHAFMAESLLRSAVARGALCQERYDFFKCTCKTISTEFAQEFALACKNTHLRESFLEKYGHLRPSTYDITSPRYSDRKGLFTQYYQSVSEEEQKNFTLTAQEKSRLEVLIDEAQLSFSPEELMEYASKVIPAREYAKFVFTRHISDILEGLAAWGEEYDVCRNDMAFLDMREITEWTYHSLLASPKEHFSTLVEKGKVLYDVGRSLKLPYLIRSPRDLYVAPQQSSAPNFIGNQCIEAPIMRLYANSACTEDIAGHIVCIENADPGFDWVFTRNIAGLITLFGGANSHMAIRCAEYGLPAAIGTGSTIFTKVAAARRCTLDAQSKKIIV